MGDASLPSTEWGRYLRRMTSRPGWSVAELSRKTAILFGEEGKVARQTIFEYIRRGGESVTIATVRKIAEALEDDFVTALLAAGNISVHAQDEQVSRIVTSGLTEAEQRDLLEYVQAVRQAQQQSLRVEVDARLRHPRAA